MGISYGSFNTDVLSIQGQLDTVGPTRLPRVRGEAGFGPLTLARVMEFQFQQGLRPDGDFGPATKARLLETKPSHGAPFGRCILVDLIVGRLRAYEDGVPQFDLRPVSGGARTTPTTRGVFKVYRRLRHHTSSKYPYPPGNMDFSLFFNGPEAIHQGPPSVPSHGCIHVEPGDAEQLFDWAGVADVMVIILKTTP